MEQKVTKIRFTDQHIHKQRTSNDININPKLFDGTSGNDYTVRRQSQPVVFILQTKTKSAKLHAYSRLVCYLLMHTQNVASRATISIVSRTDI